MSDLNVRDKDMIDFLLTRRSIHIRTMQGPGPGDADLRKILEAGMRVPDHGRLTPWRFVVIRGDARKTLGDKIAELYRANNPGAIDEQVEIERERLMRAPLVVAVVSKVVKEHKIPVWEQTLSSGAACQNILIAALSMGYAAMWVTEWYSYNADFKAALGLAPDDQIAGLVYLGTEGGAVEERARPSYDDIVSEWTGA
jgi:nitroreductase